MELFEGRTGAKILGDMRAVQKLRREVEAAKRWFSSETSTKLDIEA